MAALIIAIFPQNSSRGNWEEQQDRTDPNSRFELARKPAWLLAFRHFCVLRQSENAAAIFAVKGNPPVVQ